jgi:hypothetical protein
MTIGVPLGVQARTLVPEVDVNVVQVSPVSQFAGEVQEMLQTFIVELSFRQTPSLATDVQSVFSLQVLVQMPSWHDSPLVESHSLLLEQASARPALVVGWGIVVSVRHDLWPLPSSWQTKPLLQS